MFRAPVQRHAVRAFLYARTSGQFVPKWPAPAADLRRRVTRNKAQYSLDCDDGIEYSACLHEPSPEELVLRAERFFYLWNALNTLPEMQGRRVEACVIDDKSYAEVGRTEGVHSGSVRGSVLRGLESMKEYLKENW